MRDLDWPQFCDKTALKKKNTDVGVGEMKKDFYLYLDILFLNKNKKEANIAKT